MLSRSPAEANHQVHDTVPMTLAKQDNKVCTASNILNDDLFEIPTLNAVVIKKDIKTVHVQILIDGKRPRQVFATVTYKDCLFKACHARLLCGYSRSDGPRLRRDLRQSDQLGGGEEIIQAFDPLRHYVTPPPNPQSKTK